MVAVELDAKRGMSSGLRHWNQLLIWGRQQKTRRSGFLQDHPDILSEASEAMVDHP
jgi:hypothetical protein